MISENMSWRSILGSFVLFCLVFMVVGSQMTVASPAKLYVRVGLLIFILPGVITALWCRASPLRVALSGALLATPFCMLFLHVWFFNGVDVMQAVAFITSALFWCCSGALLVMLWRMVFWYSQRRL